jgi:hypothetical protein
VTLNKIGVVADVLANIKISIKGSEATTKSLYFRDFNSESSNLHWELQDEQIRVS